MEKTQTVNTQKRYVGIKETVLYGVANGGQCLSYNMIRGQLTFFLITVFGVPARAVTLMITIMGFWDAFNDPLMGSIVDRTRTRFGKLRPYLIFVPVPLGIITVLFFGGAEFLKGVESTGLKIAYMAITYFIWEFLYTIGDIPFWGLSAAISPNPEDRSMVIKSARFISGIVGALPGIAIPICIDLVKAGKLPLTLSQVFLILGIIGGTVGMYLFSLAGTHTKERVFHSPDEPKLLDCFRFMFKNKPLLLIVISNILSTVGGIGGVFTTYFYTLSLGVASLSLVVGIPGTIAGFFTYAIMGKLEKRFSSKKIVIMMSAIHCFVTILVFLAGIKSYTNIKVIAPLLMIQGISSSINCSISMVIPTKMISETVDYMEWKTGKRNEGMAFSVLTFVGKLTGSLSTALAALIYPIIGLSQVGQDMVLPEVGADRTQLCLWALVTCVPTVLGLISLVPYFFYDLEGDKLKNIQNELKLRQEQFSKREAE